MKAKIRTSVVIGEDLKIKTHAKTTRTLKNNELTNLSSDDRQNSKDRNIADTDDKTFWLKAGALCDCEFFETINGIKEEKPLIMLGKNFREKLNKNIFVEKSENITDGNKNASVVVEKENVNLARNIGQTEQPGQTNDDVRVTLVMKITKGMNNFLSKLHKIGAESICNQIMQHREGKYSKNDVGEDEEDGENGENEKPEATNDFNYRKKKNRRKFNRNNMLINGRKLRRNRYGKHNHGE